jgi:hypothetical protein
VGLSVFGLSVVELLVVGLDVGLVYDVGDDGHSDDSDGDDGGGDNGDGDDGNGDDGNVNGDFDCVCNGDGDGLVAGLKVIKVKMGLSVVGLSVSGFAVDGLDVRLVFVGLLVVGRKVIGLDV